MRLFVASALLLAVTLPVGVKSAQAASLPHVSVQSMGLVQTVRGRPTYRRQSDCVPTNGPFGFYGNIWCQPSEASYLRNLSAGWPQNTPPSLRYPKPSSNYEW